MSTSLDSTTAAPGLKRSLGLWDLVLYGIIVIQPTAPMPAYGAFSNAGKGHVVTAVLIAMVAMIFTAISYGRMAQVYPSAGSAYTYVGRELHPSLGFVTGWSMTMDYMLNPLICTIWCGKAMADLIPEVPLPIWFVAFALLFTLLNLRGVETSARINRALCAVMGLVILVFFVATIRYIFHLPPQGAQFFALPFYNPKTFTPGVVLHGTSLAVLTYIGFDAISTLSEAISLTLIIATIGSGMGAQLGAARLLYGMGRSEAIPKSFFGAVDPRTRIPRNNVILVGAIALAGAFLMSYERGAELLNFGALIAFMGVNLASLTHYYIRGHERTLGNLLPPIFGFVICAAIWWHLSPMAKIAGAIWMAAGVAYGAWKTRGFQADLVNFDVPSE